MEFREFVAAGATLTCPGLTPAAPDALAPGQLRGGVCGLAFSLWDLSCRSTSAHHERATTTVAPLGKAAFGELVAAREAPAAVESRRIERTRLVHHHTQPRGNYRLRAHLTSGPWSLLCARVCTSGRGVAPSLTRCLRPSSATPFPPRTSARGAALGPSCTPPAATCARTTSTTAASPPSRLSALRLVCG